LKVEQFIESIYPTQDPKALALVHAAELNAEQQKKKDADSASSWEICYLLSAVMGTLVVVSGVMVCCTHRLFSEKLPNLTKYSSWLRTLRAQDSI
jgi:farnesyl-diphosphate farnesyltransferase